MKLADVISWIILGLIVLLVLYLSAIPEKRFISDIRILKGIPK
jgi:hypothetical protein